MRGESWLALSCLPPLFAAAAAADCAEGVCFNPATNEPERIMQDLQHKGQGTFGMKASCVLTD